ncbi:MAG TPA: SH3 domain-containing protein [Sphingomicrobium sp.]|nr:SH3 domain-containing protein [Sphingomicrobium sp.]
MIASHYAAPLSKEVATLAPLRSAPGEDSEVLRELQPGDSFEMLDNSLGWAWGYAGPDRLVGYVRSGAIFPQAPTEDQSQ